MTEWTVGFGADLQSDSTKVPQRIEHVFLENEQLNSRCDSFNFHEP